MTTDYLYRLSRDLSRGRIDRRQFMMGAVASGVAVSAAMSMASSALAATPKAGGHLRQALGHGSTTDSFDPATYENGWQQNVCYSMGNHLVEVDAAGNPVPELAESFEASADAKVWRFTLRKGVTFHNGKSMTADDVIATFNYHRSEESKSAAKGVLSGVTDVGKDGNNVVVFTLAEGNADFPFIVSDYHLVIFPEKDGKMDWQSQAGTGAYIVESFEPGVRALFKKNPNYFKSGRGHFDSVETLSLVDKVARQNAVMNGDVDVIERVDPKTAHLLERVPSLKIVETTGFLHYTFPMRVNAAPFDNYDFRMAVKLSVDREEMVKKILVGRGAVGNDHPISPAVPLYADLPQRGFDPDKAKFHLKKAGYGGEALDLSASDAAFPGAVDAALLMKASAEKAGLNINVVREPNDGYWSNVWNNKPWCACYWGGRPTQDWMYSSAYVAESKWNDTAWTAGDAADKFNGLVRAARAELDTTKRAEMYAECQRLIHDDGGALVPMFANYVEGVSTKIGHPDAIAGNWQLDGNKSAERWWFA
ncbi:ABC-type dipeptide transport system, periplasmic component [SAR116 cluster alpha proteobacterium HIMB100]|nr:ABC-type dipeptide transport system, periplasmic component [SAR116 cluster alpha proteobacterium HIMB100]